MRRCAAVALGALAALTVPLTPFASAAAGAAAPSAGIAWEPCAENPAVDCGSITLPINRDDPGGPTFKLALARIKATDSAARQGSLVFNPGGPGGEGVATLIKGWNFFSNEINRRFDIIGFDPRGVGRSSPVLCSRDVIAREPHPIPRNQADFDALVAYNKERRADCRARTGPMFDHVDTGNTVHDLDALRAALGEEKLTYYGVSYGTLIGQAYAERYPGRVRALAMDGNMDHSLNTRRFLDTESWAGQDSFDAFVKWCGGSADCALNGKNVRAVWSDLLKRADRGKLHTVTKPTRPYSRAELTGTALVSFSSSDQRPLATFLAALDRDGESDPPAAFPTPPATGDTVPFANETFCQDWRLPVRDHRELARHVRRSEAISPDMGPSLVGFSSVANCLGHPDPVKDPQRRLRVKGTPPLLVSSTRHDPATPYVWATSVARQLGHAARLVTLEDGGHGAYGRGKCVTTIIDDYLISGKAPAHGTRCAKDTSNKASILRHVR
ncbi:alpha/beta hydrolase [Sinosporangium siamense]|uniref:Peptidase n=1 Tax=Sinosporangium siamense TaxID=1367973 RepID=A0A919RQU5_9ACTN|nr:alpha/beta hydrolase [Sinosporangium siamense]GII97587.1 peptidase [Sinosporangium siamense]